MAFDFLNETTQEPQLAQQQDLINLLASRASTGDPNDLSNLEEIQDSDMNDLVSIDDEETPNEEISDSDADRMSTDTHDFENEDLDATDYQLMGYIMGDGSQTATQQPRPQMQAGGSYGNAATIYSEGSAPWLKNQVNAIKFASFNRPISKYKPQLPPNPEVQQIKQQAKSVVQNDPIAQNLGIKVPEAKVGGAYTVGYKVGGAYTVGYQTGGNTLFADDEKTLRRGLNDASYSRAVLNLKGNNTIRGLDNNQPVAVTDGSKYKVLRGPNDTDTFKGKVFEKRL
jgi:hypothetical protein